MKGLTLAVAVAALVIGAGVFARSGRDHAAPPARATAAPASACAFAAGGALPDPACTPGAINHAVTQRTIKRTICKPGWATSVRPPQSVTEPAKFKAMRAYGIPTTPGHAQLYEYDHLIPIELGGALSDPRNLFPEPHAVTGATGQDEGSFAKDKIENRLRALVCAGAATLARARAIMRTDWRTAP